MSKIELDDQILDHPKFLRAVRLAGSDAVHLWLGLRAYCAKLLTDGFIPSDMVDEVRGPKDQKRRAAAIYALRTANLVEDCEGGVRLHDYLDHAPSRAQVLAWRKANTERKAKSRAVSRCDSQRDNKRDNKRDTTVTDGVTTSGVPAPSPSSSSSSIVSFRDTRETATEPERQAKPKRERRAPTPPPENFEPDAATLAVAAETGRDWRSDWLACRDWHLAKGEKKLDYQATLRGWMRRGLDSPRSGGSSSNHRPPPQPNDPNNRYRPRMFELDQG